MSQFVGPLLFATTNRGKQVEALEVADRYGVPLVTVDQISREKNQVEVPEVLESAADYAGNARLKAEAFAAWSGLAAVADDTGLEVQALGGAPGILSARFAGEQGNMKANIAKLLKEMEGQNNRQAFFRCVLCLVQPSVVPLTVEGILTGEIAREPRGAGGFGYDNVFVVAGCGRTLAELKEAKVEIKTHRILALEKLFAQLSQA